ncbi:MAG TPA: GNAT family protein [Fimbriimonadaceae bacterium]|nr:GNAT family protein [Fimbriimonadaceae bacterium]
MGWVQPAELRGNRVVLTPLHREHAKELFPLLEPETFKYYVTIQPPSYDLTGATAFVEMLLNAPNTMAFVVRLASTGELIGMSCYMDIRENQRGLEIGMTWIVPAHRGTAVNPEMKFLMLRHAFEQFKALRVQLKTDGRNLHSQNAIKKLGAVYEGTLRKHGIQPNGYVRDTVLFSILDTEWPAVERKLLDRISPV